jgi:hypothetical protein
MLFVLASCSATTEPGPQPFISQGAGQLSIQTSAPEYARSAETEDLLEVRATIRNDSPQTFYARLGDGFNGSMDQELLFAASGSDGYVERRTSSETWLAVQGGILIEGVRVIALRPGTQYQLSALVTDAGSTGVHRIRVDYSDRPDGGATGRRTDYSNTFVIR